MVQYTMRKQVAAPQERIFDVATDLRRADERIDGIKKLEVQTEGPIRVGTRFAETRVMFRKECTEVMEITAFDRPNSYSVGCENHGCKYHTQFDFIPNASGTEVVMTFDVQPQTFMGKVMGIVFRPLMKMCMKQVDRDLECLKAAAEGTSELKAGSAPRSETG